MKSRILVIFLLGFFLVQPAWALSDKIVAVINNEVITQSELQQFLALAYTQLASQYKGKELQEEFEKAKSGILNRMIEDKLILQEAKKKNIEVKDDRIKNRIEQIKQGFASQEGFEQMLSEQGLTLGDLRKRTKEQFMIFQLVDEEVRSKTIVGPDEVTSFYQEHKDQFKESTQRKVGSIFLKNEQEAQEASNLLKQGQDIIKVAERFGQSVTSRLVKEGQLRKDIEDAVFNLKVQENSNPIKTDQGFFIFKLEEIIAAQQRSPSESYDEIYHYLLEQKFRDNMKEWLDALKKKSYIVIK
ncbi:MAG: peptidyl-prolyl cis-trans isomerase [Candidatus Omnitrophota bacterium]